MKSIILSKLLIAFSSALTIYIIYRSEISNMGAAREYYYLEFFITLSLLIFSIFLIYTNVKIREILLITFFSVTFFLYLLELFLVFDLKNYNNRVQYEKESNLKYDNRSRYEILKDTRKKNIKTVLTLPAGYIYLTVNNEEILILSGIPNSKTIHCNENGYYSTYESDRYGFNNPDKEWERSDIEFVIVGDSYVHGSCVNRPHDISSVLRRLSNKGVINLGYDGSNPTQYYARLKEFMPKKVKNILWFFYEGNDLVKLDTDKILKDYLNDEDFSQEIISKYEDINIEKSKFFENEFESYKPKNLIRDFLKLYSVRHMIKWKSAQKQEIDLEVFKRSLKRSISLAKKNNSNFYFFYIFSPESISLMKQSKKNPNLEDVKKITSELGIQIYFAFDSLSDYNKDIFYPRFGGHFSEEGYRNIAENVYKKIAP